MNRSFDSMKLFLLFPVMTMLALTTTETKANPAVHVEQFKLDNGMQVVVIPNSRAPVITHIVFYRIGSADEPRGVSGIAHFLEHLMFKSTDKIESGEFSKIVARLGGNDNAFTGHDATAYFQRIAKEHLRTVMEMEADRMVNLRLTEQEVATERSVILEERGSRIENNPEAILSEQMDAILYYAHPYGTPIIGWEHEIAKLSREDALGFYGRYYAPGNAILVVAGDVTPDVVKGHAEETFGKITNGNDKLEHRDRAQDPPPRAARRVEIKDPRAGKASLHRDYVVPSYITAEPVEAAALELLARILADGPTSRLYRKLVVEDKIASSTEGGYWGSALDSGKIGLYAIAADGTGLEKVESVVDEVISELRDKGVTEAELNRAKSGEIADFTYDSDNQANLARRYGLELAIGRSLDDIQAWPETIAKVTLEDVQRAAQKYLEPSRSVTGTLIPATAGTTSSTDGRPVRANGRS